MPYALNADLPKSVRDALPEHGQTIFRKAFTAAEAQYGTEDEAKLMKVAWAAVKNVYEQEDDKWVLEEGIKGVSEAFTTNDPTWIPVAKVGQKVNYKDGRGVKILTEEALKTAQGTWKGKPILRNHNEIWDDYKILDEKFDSPFLYMKLDSHAEAALRSSETTGASIDVDGMKVEGEELTDMFGTGLSVLWDRSPACTSEMGCASIQDDINGDSIDMTDKKEEITYTSEQTKQMIASAVAEITENLDNAHTVEITKLKDETATTMEKLETEHEVAIKSAEEVAFNRAQARATFIQKFGIKEDSELVKGYDAANTVEKMQAVMNSIELPTGASSLGISSASGKTEEEKPHRGAEIGSYNTATGKWE